MRSVPTSPSALSILGLLRPHWIAMTLALVGVAGEAAASLLEPWPLKIVLDYLLQARPLPGWMMPLVGGSEPASWLCSTSRWSPSP